MARRFNSLIVNVSDLRELEGENIEELVEFLKEKTGTKVDVSGNEIRMKAEKGDQPVPPKDYLRTLLRKFLHRTELKDGFRVISSGENVFSIKTRREARIE